MRRTTVAEFSDIHGNYHAFKACYEILGENGDIYDEEVCHREAAKMGLKYTEWRL